MVTGRRRTAGAGLALLTVVVLAASWWTRPTSLEPAEERVAQRVAVGSPVDVVVVPRLPADLTLRSVEPDLPDGVARADVEVLLCERADDAGPTVSVTGDLTSVCSTVRPASAGARTRASESLLVRVTALERGDVELRGLRVRYSRDARHLWRTGTQLLPTEIRLITP